MPGSRSIGPALTVASSSSAKGSVAGQLVEDDWGAYFLEEKDAKCVVS